LAGAALVPPGGFDKAWPAMILYRLRCSGDHEFEAWFKDSGTYDEQAAAGAIACPDCGDTVVAKAPMAPRIARGRGEGASIPAAPAGGDEATAGAGDGGAKPNPGKPARTYTHARSGEMRRALMELRRKVEDTCDYVGPDFAEEARKIHYGEADERNIYGEATDAEAEELVDEGIKVGKIPWLPRTDS